MVMMLSSVNRINIGHYSEPAPRSLLMLCSCKLLPIYVPAVFCVLCNCSWCWCMRKWGLTPGHPAAIVSKTNIPSHYSNDLSSNLGCRKIHFAAEIIFVNQGYLLYSLLISLFTGHRLVAKCLRLPRPAPDPALVTVKCGSVLILLKRDCWAQGRMISIMGRQGKNRGNFICWVLPRINGCQPGMKITLWPPQLLDSLLEWRGRQKLRQ